MKIGDIFGSGVAYNLGPHHKRVLHLTRYCALPNESVKEFLIFGRASAFLFEVGWADGFVKVSWFTIGILGLLAVTSFGIDFYLASFGVKRFGASKLAMFGATAGMLVGMFFGIVGLLVGPFVGAFLGELVMRKDLKQAGKAGGGAWLGLAIGIAAKIALVFTMIGIFVLAYIF